MKNTIKCNFGRIKTFAHYTSRTMQDTANANLKELAPQLRNLQIVPTTNKTY